MTVKHTLAVSHLSPYALCNAHVTCLVTSLYFKNALELLD